MLLPRSRPLCAANESKITAGTYEKLVERLTSHQTPGTAFLRAFLLTYRSFATPASLLELLVMRYDMPRPRTSDRRLLELFGQKQEIVRNRHASPWLPACVCCVCVLRVLCVRWKAVPPPPLFSLLS